MLSMIARVSGAIQAALAFVLMAMVLLCCANIVLRYFFDISYLAADELLVFGMVVIAFLGAISISSERQHLRMDVLVHSAPPAVKWLLGILESLVTVGAAGFMTWASAGFVQRVYAMDQRSSMADLPMWLPHGTVMVCFGAITLIALLRIPQLLKTEGELS
ncbi:MAG: TRAP transporter small permease [Alcaligenaceae bacterium]|nr:TRAP transporter small permease [Alcaligenaceae bacterium]